MAKRLLLYDVGIASVYNAAHIDIIAKIITCDLLECLRFTKVGITSIDNPAGIHVTEKNAHSNGKIVRDRAVAQTKQIYHETLSITNVSEVDCNMITVNYR